MPSHTNSSLLKARRRRTLLREYKALMAKPTGHDVLKDLEAVRGDR